MNPDLEYAVIIAAIVTVIGLAAVAAALDSHLKRKRIRRDEG